MYKFDEDFTTNETITGQVVSKIFFFFMKSPRVFRTFNNFFPRNPTAFMMEYAWLVMSPFV